MAEVIQGYIEHIIFRNEENGYTVFQMQTEDMEEMTCIGSFPQIHAGEFMEAQGSLISHPVYGEQFKIEQFRVKIPDEKTAFERYLGSGAIKGIGEKLAGRILKHFGEETQWILENEPERLSEIKGISESKAADISNQLAEKFQLQNALIFLAQYGISYQMGLKIYKQYQDRLYQVLQENPYRLAEDISGIGFKIADRIAEKAGIGKDSEYRIKCGILYCLGKAGADGHTHLPIGQLKKEVEALLEIDTDQIEQYVGDLSIEKKIILKEQKDEGIFVYLSSVYFMELNAARMLQDLNVRLSREDVSGKIRELARKDALELDPLQFEAVLASVRSGVTVITGGPGTGKTTTINTLIRYFQSENMEIALAAPTGRAARRMEEATGYEASTIHRLLEVSGKDMESDGGKFERNAQNPLEYDVIMIDEMSMVDIYLMHALLCAVVPGTRLILVGDVNQLPSVGPGSVLKDIIEAGTVEVVCLKHIFRQAAQSDIVMNAHRIHAGKNIVTDNKSKDFFFLERLDPEVICQAVLYLVEKKLPGYVHADPFDIQVLTPMHKGMLGDDRLNSILQQHLNPPDRTKEEYEGPYSILRTGDKVMQIKNNYQLEWQVRGQYDIKAQSGMGIFNGDIGTIRKIDLPNEILEVEFEESKIAVYSFSQLDELKLAYAITIHKSQGSEYPAIVIPLLSGPKMLMTRNLLYTAVTRARSCVILVGSKEVFRKMIENDWEEYRFSSLHLRMKEIAGLDAAFQDIRPDEGTVS